MEDEASDFSDWEVLSAASGAGGHEDAVLVSGEGGDILHDHFAFDPSSPAGFSGNRSWSEAASDDVEIESGLGSLERFGFAPQPQELMDLIAVADSSAQLRLGGVDVIAQASSVLGASVGCGGGAQEKQTEVLSCGEFDLVPQAARQGVEGILDSDATAVANTLQEETEPGGDGKDGSSPLLAAAAPVTGEAERQVLEWWRLPFRLIHYCAWKVRPVWSISIATALLGLAVLGRRMYRMRRKTQGLPQIKISFDDKRASQFPDRAARLSEAFLIAKRVPALLRTSSGAALPWSMMQER